jgi:diadenosine tetraphosphate (Ap4A) HIT family hydrolase
MAGKTECLFCNLDHAILAETDLSRAFLDTFPVSQGHTLVIPKRHIETIWEMTNEEYSDAFDLIRKVKHILKRKFDPHGFNVGVNCGDAAGQLYTRSQESAPCRRSRLLPFRLPSYGYRKKLPF